jgi:hypothetical protein
MLVKRFFFLLNAAFAGNLIVEEQYRVGAMHTDRKAHDAFPCK